MERGLAGQTRNEQDGNNGGAALQSSITGSAAYYGGGGGGGAYANYPGDLLELAVLGEAALVGTEEIIIPTCWATAGTAQTGSGGGAGGSKETDQLVTPERRGSGGVVILRMPTADYSGTTTGSPTVATDGSDTILKFTGSGSYTH